MAFHTGFSVEERVGTAIDVQPGILVDSGALLADLAERFDRVHVVVDERLPRVRRDIELLLNRVTSCLPRSTVLALAGGERTKSVQTLTRLVHWFDSCSVKRRAEVVLGIGGGALLDSVSLAASLYRRGVTFWRAPTTLLAAIDAGIGAKSAVNFFGRKNLLGTYQLPARVIVDPLVLDSLPPRQIRSGLAEAFKLGLAVDAELLKFLVNNAYGLAGTLFDPALMHTLIVRSISSMTAELAADLFEKALLHPTDLGHSFSRRFEEVIRPRLLHGEAVALDISFSAKCSEVTGVGNKDSTASILDELKSLRLPTTHRALDLPLLEAAHADVVVHRGSNLYPLPVGPGHVVMAAIDVDTLKAGLMVHPKHAAG